MLKSILEKLKDRLGKMHRDDGGAVALLMMASIMITFMLGLVIFDAGFIAEDKLEVQAAADTASWSQSAVEARAMNMMAFANVGKRITVGIISYYEALWMALAGIALVTLALVVICWIAFVIATIFSLGSASEPLRQACTTLTVMFAEQVYMMVQEGEDLKELASNLMKAPNGYFQKDAEAFGKYQDYMFKIAPWWGWGEGFMRGFRNGAITTSWPVPTAGSSGGGGGGGGSLFGGLGIGGSNIGADTLPVLKARTPDEAKDNLCKRIYGNNDEDAVSEGGSGLNVSDVATDILVHTADYAIKTLGDSDAREDQVQCQGACGFGDSITNNDRMIYLVLMGLLAIPLTSVACKDNMNTGNQGVLGTLSSVPGVSMIVPEPFRQNGWPYMIRDHRSGVTQKPVWLRMSSNLTFAYRRGHDRGDGKYEAFTAWSRHQGNVVDGLTEMTQGVWAVSRSEISFQYASNQPDLWHPSWVARMRPVSLPGEWQGAGATISQAFGDALPLMARGVVLETVAGTGFGLDMVADGVRMSLALQAMSNGNMDGVSK